MNLTRIRTRSARRLRRVAVALAIAVSVPAVNAPRADAAVDPQTVIAAAKAAYSAYQLLQGGQLTLQQATDRILSAINGARAEIIAHMDQLAAADGRACARAAVSDLENMRRFTTDVAQQYARDTVACLNLIDSRLVAVTDKGAIDQLGFALNGLGPVVLISHANVGFTTSSGRATLRAANNTVITKLYPSCQATPLFGDAEPGGTVEVMLRCRAHNGDVGYDTAFSRTPRTTTYDFTSAADQATRNTSRALAKAVLPTI